MKREFNKLVSKENAEQFKNKIREEMKNAVNKDDFLDKEDAMLINHETWQSPLLWSKKISIFLKKNPALSLVHLQWQG